MNSKNFYFILLSLFALATLAQEEVEVVTMPDSSEKEVLVFNRVEEIPLIEGCKDNSQTQANRDCFGHMMVQHVITNFNYPNGARKHGVQGKMYINFVIEKDGSVANVELLRSAESLYKDNEKLVKYARLLDEEAIRVISSVKIIKPARQRGEPVRISYVMPINASLQ